MSDPVLNEIRGMVVFTRVVEAGSFSAAAKRLGVSRAVVSYQIKQHEQSLGARLLNRSTRKISLTAAGERYFEKCRKVAHEAEQAHSLLLNLKQNAVGHVSLACPVNIGMRWIVPLAHEFRLKYPDITLNISFSEELSNIIEDGIDLAVRSGPLTDSDLHAVKLTVSYRYICASPQFLIKYGLPKSPSDLTHYEWVVYKRHNQSVTLSKGNITHEVSIKGPIHTNSAAARLQFALKDHGLALLPDFDAQPEIDAGRLIRLFPDYSLPELELFAVFPKGSTTAKATRLLLDMLKAHHLAN
jgi:DNA-binding transcriptional LysR family regulator